MLDQAISGLHSKHIVTNNILPKPFCLGLGQQPCSLHLVSPMSAAAAAAAAADCKFWLEAKGIEASELSERSQ